VVCTFHGVVYTVHGADLRINTYSLWNV